MIKKKYYQSISIFVFFLILFPCLSAQAQNAESSTWKDNFVPAWEAKCTYHHNEFSIAFKSQSGDATEDDLHASMIWNGAKPIQLQIPVALYLQTVHFHSNFPSLCNKLDLFEITANRLLLLLHKDDRPEPPHVVAVLIDGGSGKILDENSEIGVEPLDPVANAAPNGVRLELVKSWDNSSELTEPKEIYGWKRVNVVGEKLNVYWEK